MLKLPLWFVTDPGQAAPYKSPTNKPSDMLAFSSWPKLKAFLAQCKVSASAVVVAHDHVELLTVIADIHARGGNAIYLDPDLDGHGGECIYLTDIDLVGVAKTDTKGKRTAERKKRWGILSIAGLLFALAGLIFSIAGHAAIGITTAAIGVLFIGIGAGPTK